MSRDGIGFVCPNGVWLHSNDFRHPLRSYLLWSVDSNKEVRWAQRNASRQMNIWARERQEICRELAKWGSKECKSIDEDSSSDSSSRRKRGRPRGSRKKTMQ
ncbi:hypothetical protein SUGI_0434550 [Cryptomeria japonica]|nr:hypothetical protein SUGI_0434550 [Cryptomeria japonica]